MSLGRLFKDPNATLDYTVDWSGWLEGDETIASAAWTVAPAGLTIVNQSFSGSAHTIWLSGGTVAVRYTVTSHVTTNSAPARIDDRSFDIVIKEQ